MGCGESRRWRDVIIGSYRVHWRRMLVTIDATLLPTSNVRLLITSRLLRSNRGVQRSPLRIPTRRAGVGLNNRLQSSRRMRPKGGEEKTGTAHCSRLSRLRRAGG